VRRLECQRSVEIVRESKENATVMMIDDDLNDAERIPACETPGAIDPNATHGKRMSSRVPASEEAGR